MEIATLFPGFYTKCLQPGSQRYLHSLSIAALFTIEKIWKQSEWLLIHGWIKNMSGILSFAVKISQKNEVILKAGKGSKKVEYVGLWGSKLGDRLACRRFTRSYFQNQRLWEGMQNWTEGEVGWDEVHQKCQSNPGRALKLRRAFRDAKSRGSGLFIPSLVSHWMKTALGRRDTLGQGGLALLRQFLEGNENWPLLVRIIPNGWENKSLIPQEGSEWHILEFTSKGLLKYGTPPLSFFNLFIASPKLSFTVLKITNITSWLNTSWSVPYALSKVPSIKRHWHDIGIYLKIWGLLFWSRGASQRLLVPSL